MLVSQTFGSTPHLPDVVLTPQLTTRANTSVGVEMIRESILTGHTVTDDDGSLKLKQIEEFTDSKAFLDFVQAVTAAKTKE